METSGIPGWRSCPVKGFTLERGRCCPHLSLGGEVFWAGQHRKSSLGYAARYNIDNMFASGQIASTELLLLAMFIKCLKRFHSLKSETDDVYTTLDEKNMPLVIYNQHLLLLHLVFRYNFNKVAQYKQLTLEEAEEKIKNRRKTANEYERWMMKAANNGATAFGEVERPNDKEGGGGGGGGRGRKKNNVDDDEGNVSDRGEEDEDEEFAKKNRLGLNKRGGDDDEEGPRGGDLDFDDDDIEKGDDWEHEEIFTDVDEAVDNDPEECEDLLSHEIPAPPEIK
ncbi:hypothetical protein Lser_V15G12465 [Lactuca serriola]